MDMEGGRPRGGIRPGKEERSLPTNKPLCGIWTKLGVVSFLEVQVRSGAQLTRGLLSSTPLWFSSKEVGGRPGGVTAPERAA